MVNTSIWATSDQSFDIGCRVVKWDESDGFDFTPNHNYITRDGIYYDELNSILKQFTVHWANCYRAKDVYTVLCARQLSVNFIIDDDVDDNGFATIYQTLSIQHGAYSQGNGCNGIGSGVEMAYMADAWDHQDRYSDTNMQKHNTQTHDCVSAPVHGTKIRVFLPTEAQIKSLVQLIWGYTSLFPDIPISFPRNKDGTLLLTKLTKPTEYSGLLNHFNISREKVDTAGLDLDDLESRIKIQKEVGY